MKQKKPELLAPAGNMEKLKMAILYGADAVYLGGEAYGLRAQGGNFSKQELAEAARFVHERGKKIYVTVNVYPHNAELAALPDYLRYLQAIGADAILVSDLGVFSVARETVPELSVHISTQANTVNYAAVNAWARLGAERVVLAREVPLEDIKEIRQRISWKEPQLCRFPLLLPPPSIISQFYRYSFRSVCCHADQVSSAVFSCAVHHRYYSCAPERHSG